LKTELVEVKAALAEEKALNTKRHEDLMSILSTLSAKFSSSSLEQLYPLIPSLFCLPFFLTFLPVLDTVLNCLFLHIMINCGYPNLGWLCLACFLKVNCLCVTWMTNIINVP